MDIKQLNKLDPKLKETYERVMGTGTKTTPVVPVQSFTAQRPQPFQPVQPQPAQQSTQPFKPVQTQSAAQAMQRPQTQNLKKKNKILPVFLTLGFIVFLIGYTFFWIKFFKLKLPFLPF